MLRTHCEEAVEHGDTAVALGLYAESLASGVEALDDWNGERRRTRGRCLCEQLSTATSLHPHGSAPRTDLLTCLL